MRVPSDRSVAHAAVSTDPAQDMTAPRLGEEPGRGVAGRTEGYMSPRCWSNALGFGTLFTVLFVPPPGLSTKK